jgi:antitoxin FitA
MPSITIRDVPASARDELAARAAASGRSLQEYLKSELIGLAQRPDTAVLLQRIRDRKRLTESRLSAAQILDERDTDRR